MVGVAFDDPVPSPPIEPGDGRVLGNQGGRDHSGVGVDPRHVRKLPAHYCVYLSEGGCSALGPPGLVPTVREQHRAFLFRGVALQLSQRLSQARRLGEVEGGQRKAGEGKVHVRINESGGHQAAI